MDDVRIGDLLFTARCDIEGMDVFSLDKKLLGAIIFQVVDVPAFTVRYLGVVSGEQTFLVPAELILDVDDLGLIMDFEQKIFAKLLPLPESWEEVFARDYEEKIYSTLNLTPYWQ
ncbi:MAG: hypothetical protein ACOX29_04975 [Bacillota bacterium]|jgi:hypothetical protein|nr:hypothetical protein [Bacillota bacterium]NLU54053.1 hypothetical protein [Bacillota bacterium]HOA91777.1 hypothetical protein [Bacillota bacterium]HOJ46885.1 hypothetical protein [Bacillota bacterium]HOP54530.1 hypothetical protein [Bacillota bacterium]